MQEVIDEDDRTVEGSDRADLVLKGGIVAALFDRKAGNIFVEVFFGVQRFGHSVRYGGALEDFAERNCHVFAIGFDGIRHRCYMVQPGDQMDHFVIHDL